MKTRAVLIVAAIAALSVFASVADAQYAGMPSPYGFQPPGGMYAPGPSVMAVNYAPPSVLQAGPVAAPGVPMVGQAGQGGAKGGSVVDDGKGGKGKGDCQSSRWAFYGDFIYLRPRDAEVAYAVPIDGPIVGAPTNFPIQIGPIGVIDMDFQPGFRAGFRYNMNSCNALGVEYTFYEGNTFNQVLTQAPDVIRSNVSHPGTQTAAQDFLEANAEYDLSHDIVDVNYYNLLIDECDRQLTMVSGLRVIQHEQNLQVDFAGTGTETVMTDVDFYGAGVRAGLEFDRFISGQWLVYAKGYGSLIPGEFRADYDQSQSYDSVVVDTGWKAGRLVTIWDLELGLSWLSKCGNYRLNAGYVYSAWTNMVQTDEWISAVRQNSYIDMDSTMTYDGVTARFEVRY